MTPKRKNQDQMGLFFSLTDTLNSKHPLFILAHQVNWTLFEKAFEPLYCTNNGRSGKPIRLMAGLLILKHIRNVSDESVIEQWSENIYYQYFVAKACLFLVSRVKHQS